MTIDPQHSWIQRDIIFVTGKGGVGKTAVVAALAQLLSETRGPVTTVEFSAHPRLAQIIGNNPRIQTLNIEAEQAVEDVLARLLKLPKMVTKVLNNRVINLFVRTSPAIKEMILLAQIAALQSSDNAAKPLLIDLPSSGHALSFLDTPRAVKNMLRVGPIAQLADSIAHLFSDAKHVAIVVVALAEELPVNETIELTARLKTLELPPAQIIVNRVPLNRVAQEDVGLLDQLETSNDHALGHVANLVKEAIEQQKQAQQQITRLQEAVGQHLYILPLCRVGTSRDRVAALSHALKTTILSTAQ